MTTKNAEPLEDDGHLTPEVGAWAEEKYRYVRGYAEVFTTAMAGKWESLVYVDLFAGAGRARLEGSSRIVAASPLIALGVAHPFDRYIFCERDEERLAALRQRVARDFPAADVRFVPGDVNRTVATVLKEMPEPGPGRRVLSFCFADPYSCRNLAFATIRQLAARFVDFLILIPSGFDANRNRQIYESPRNETLDGFFGDPDWRAAWKERLRSYRHFADFVTDHYGRQMAKMGYRYEGLHDSWLVRSTEKNLPLYDLALFSRHPLGEKLGREVRKYNRPQRGLFD